MLTAEGIIRSIRLSQQFGFNRGRQGGCFGTLNPRDSSPPVARFAKEEFEIGPDGEPRPVSLPREKGGKK